MEGSLFRGENASIRFRVLASAVALPGAEACGDAPVFNGAGISQFNERHGGAARINHTTVFTQAGACARKGSDRSAMQNHDATAESFADTQRDQQREGKSQQYYVDCSVWCGPRPLRAAKRPASLGLFF